jgi:hypothetical protein
MPTLIAMFFSPVYESTLHDEISRLKLTDEVIEWVLACQEILRQQSIVVQLISFLVCYGIVGVRLCTFEGIARTTGKPEILFFIAPVPRKQPLRTEAVPATLRCHRADAKSNICWNVLATHGAKGSRNP